MSQLARHEFSPEESSRGGTNSAKGRKELLKLQKKMLKLQSREQWMELLKVLFSNPAATGTLLYLIVHTMNVGANKQPTNQNNQGLRSWLQTFFDSGLLSAFGVNPLGNALDLDALELAILAYIATGGNIVGAGTSLISSVTALLNQGIPK